MGFNTVKADSDYNSALILVRFVIISEATRFGRATRREVLRVEVQNHDFFPEELFQTHGMTIFIHQRKIRSCIANFELSQQGSPDTGNDASLGI
jgi:hypothetical protein